jgi:uncharacterized protein YeeX (DUF496 family)
MSKNKTFDELKKILDDMTSDYEGAVKQYEMKEQSKELLEHHKIETILSAKNSSIQELLELIGKDAIKFYLRKKRIEDLEKTIGEDE